MLGIVDDPITFLGAIAVIAVFIVIILIWLKKENKIKNEMVAALSEEVRNDLKDNQVQDYDYQRNIWTQKAWIGSVKDKGSKVALKLLWYNTVIQNATLHQFQYADVTMKKADFESRGLKQGSIVKMRIDPNTARAELVW